MPATAANFDTLADVLHALGDIPPDRILWNPFPGTATEADLLRRERHDSLLELIEGMLIEKPTAAWKSFASALFVYHLLTHVRRFNSGVVAGPGCLMRLKAGTVRMPDVCYSAWETMPKTDSHLQSIAEFPPDIAVEIPTPRMTNREAIRRRNDYFAAGSQLVWFINLKARTVAVYTDPNSFSLLRESDTLTGGDVLPGFELPLAEFFNDPQLQPKA
ncbi:MAG: Uma2 family endonuclease [Gemmataceae bacterium]|nr:Uma2 family endonuclease [Gemmataceae bacterium]